MRKAGKPFRPLLSPVGLVFRSRRQPKPRTKDRRRTTNGFRPASFVSRPVHRSTVGFGSLRHHGHRPESLHAGYKNAPCLGQRDERGRRCLGIGFGRGDNRSAEGVFWTRQRPKPRTKDGRRKTKCLRPPSFVLSIGPNSEIGAITDIGLSGYRGIKKPPSGWKGACGTRVCAGYRVRACLPTGSGSWPLIRTRSSIAMTMRRKDRTSACMTNTVTFGK